MSSNILDDINEYKLNRIQNDAYDDGLEKLFDDPDYYAQPKNTKVYLNINGKEELIGNAVVANIEESNEKIPVYSYNSPTYNKYLQGKKIVTGVIALRKITVANFLSMIKYNDTVNKKIGQKQFLLNKINDLSKINNNSDVLEMIRLLKKEIEDIDNFSFQDFNMYSQGDVSLALKNNLIDYLDDFKKDDTSVARGRIKIVFEGTFGPENTPIVNIKDVLFLKKQTEISVERNDIFEVYSFIGNPSN